MEEIFAHVVSVLLPVLLCAGVGLLLAVTKSPMDTKVVGGIVARVGYPALILSHLAGEHISFESFLTVLAAGVFAVASFGVIGFAVLKVLRLPIAAFLSPLMHGNVGNIGLPVASLAFGDTGLAVGLAFVIVVLVSTFSIGIAVTMGKPNWKGLLKQPVIYASALALFLMGTGLKLPEPVNQAFTVLGGLSIPLMLLVLGYTLVTLKPGRLGPAFGLGVVHLAMAAGIAFVVTALFGFEGTTKDTVVLMCFMPASLGAYLWVSLYQPDHAADVAGYILISTLMTIAVLPVILTYWI